MTRTQDNSLLHRTAGTGIVPPLEVLLSVALRCGSVAVASAIVAFAFGLAFVSGFVFLPSLARLLLWALPAAFAYGHQSLHTVSLPLHVWPPSLPDVNIWALFEGTYQLLERVMDVGETILASPTLARPDVQWLLVGGLTMVTVLLWIHVEPWLASLDGREASGEDAEPCDDEGVVYAEEAEGDNQQGWCMECVVGSQGRWYAEYVAGDKFWLAPTVDVCDTAVSDPGDADEQYLDAAEWAEEVSPVGDFVGTGGEDGGAEDEGTTDEEDGSLDAEEEVTGDTPPQDLVESYGTSASEVSYILVHFLPLSSPNTSMHRTTLQGSRANLLQLRPTIRTTALHSVSLPHPPTTLWLVLTVTPPRPRSP
ncbi:hypothetical protein BDW22DRAFT_224357 [Trametopsis cervina]|nr:hypothetical protein BDW22DRAFT_224357 [Trametopsis cervina]